MALSVGLVLRRFTSEEYLTIEREADFKSEFLCGQIYAMSGGSPRHSTITVNVTALFVIQLKGNSCQAFSNDVKVRSTPEGLYSYPDLSVVCGEPRFHDKKNDVLINPKVIIEVLSPSTQAFDRGLKWAHYQMIDSLTDYLLIAQDAPRITHFFRRDGGAWEETEVIGLNASVTLASIGCVLPLADVYDRVAWTS